MYLMKNPQGLVIYVGKAKNLKSRIKQYFAASPDERAMIPILVPQIEEIETIVVPSEKEALILENNLIKRHKPKFNALLKDDKTFISLMINHKHTWPTLKLVRYKGKPSDQGLYFGPYASADAARRVYEIIFSLFPLRQCSDEELKRRTRPCILYSIKKCCAPCMPYCTPAEYKDYVQGTKAFLRGEEKGVLKELKKKMQVASEALEFEKAADILRTIRQIEHVLISSNTIVQGAKKDYDVLGFCRSQELAALIVLYFREGKLLGSEQEIFSRVLENDEELITSFLLQHYAKKTVAPQEVLIPLHLDNIGPIQEILAEHFEKKVSLHAGDSRERLSLLQLAEDNARVLFLQANHKDLIQEALLYDLQETFQLTRFPYRIECFDNSNMSGSDLVSSMVVFIDGKKVKSHKRLYKIRDIDTPDDLAAMRQVLHRRLAKGKEVEALPDLILIDGGKNHLQIAMTVLQELEIASVDLIAISKERGRHDKGMTKEKFFTPATDQPIVLPPSSALQFFLQNIRDEAHTAAIGFHKQRRSKRIIGTALLEIPGIGPVKMKNLLRAFGSMKNIFAASPEALLAIQGITKKDVLTIEALAKKP